MSGSTWRSEDDEYAAAVEEFAEAVQAAVNKSNRARRVSLVIGIIATLCMMAATILMVVQP